MIITQTPFRMSFFGGGTDMESFFRENGGAVLSTTFDKYCYVNVRHLPRFFDYSTELSYSKTERVTCIEDIQHPAIRNAMKMLDMKNKQIKLLVERYPVLKAIENEVFNAYQILENCYAHGGKLLVSGNGGSAADAEHIVGELMKGFKLPRKPDADFAEKLVAENQEFGSVLAENLQGALPAIALDGHPALSTAYMNDCEPLLCFAQQVNGYGKAGDVFLGISTSGNSKNVLYAATTAHAKGMKVIGLTGAKSSKLEQMSDICIKVPQTETYMIQELHLPVYHCLCLMLEERFFGENG